MTPMATCISLTKVSKCYGSTVAVGGLSLEVQTGEVLGLLGPNGAGKSTTLHLMAGLVRPSSGAVSVFGKDLQKNSIAALQRMGVLLERPAFYDYLSVRRHLKLQARLAQHRGNVERILDMVGLLHVERKRIGALSQGLRQRLAIAQALLTEPALLLLDEPTSGLDVESSQEILRFLRRLADEANVTIVFSSHFMHEAEYLCDRVAILNQGDLLACDSTATLLAPDLNRVEVCLEGAEGAARKLRTQTWVEAVDVRAGRLDVRMDGASVHQLVAFLVTAGYHIAAVVPRQRTLQDFLLKVLNQ